jgi:hypothetical protein
MTELRNWNAGLLDRYRERLEAGLHDYDCEQRERYGLCDCAKRKRLIDGPTELPTLWYQAPQCSGCLSEATHDGDGWVCYRCHVQFGEYDEQGTWMDENGPHDASAAENYGERMIVLATRVLPPGNGGVS